MPKRLTADAPRMKRAQLARMKVAMLEMKGVQPYIVADMDADTRREVQTTLLRVSETIASVARWIGEPARKPSKPTTEATNG